MNRQRIAGLLLALLSANWAQAAATIVVQNIDGLNEGLNDTAAFTPVGGNNATTLGQARMNVMQEAARIWGQQLTSAVPIVIEARFDPITGCTATTGTLGSAGPMGFLSFPSAPVPNVNYPVALANAITGTDQAPGSNDISARFNSDIGLSTCLGGRPFYLGFDHVLTPVGGVTPIDLLAVVLHEYGHGLGFYSGVEPDGSSGFASGRFTIYDQFGYSETLGKYWSAMTQAERASSTVSNGSLVFNGANLNARIGLVSAGVGSSGSHVRLFAPSTFDSGSSLSHFDTVTAWTVNGVSRGLLMQPFIRLNPFGLTDFTGCLFADLGWGGTHCPDIVGIGRTVATAEDTVATVPLDFAGGAGGSVTYAISTQPTRGTLTAPASLTSATGVVFSYTPSLNFNGADTFTFTVASGGTTSAPATVTINVAAVNDPPVANDQTVSVLGGQTVAITLTGSDVDSANLNFTVLNNPTRGTLSGSAPNLSYTAPSNFTGTDSLTFRVSDGQLDSGLATVTINITQPVAISSGGGGGGGGGAMDWSALLALALLWLLAGGEPSRCRAARAALFRGRQACLPWR